MLQSKQLTFSYNPQKQFVFPDITCEDGKSLLILGQSGKGKTTLLHLLALLLKPQSGQVWVNSREVAGFNPKQLAHIRAQHIGIIYQKAHFVTALSVLDNMLLSNYLADQQQDRDRAVQLAEQLGFSDHLSKKTNQLSQGEQQRVSIARALMNHPSVILADEPTSSLDDRNCDRVVALLKEHSSRIGASLVVVTHDQRLKDIFPDRVVL